MPNTVRGYHHRKRRSQPRYLASISYSGGDNSYIIEGQRFDNYEDIAAQLAHVAIAAEQANLLPNEENEIA